MSADAGHAVPDARRGDYRYDAGFVFPERVPWSELGPDFIATWGLADPGNPQPEHLEIIGQNGSGKTHLLFTMLHDRYRARETAGIFVATKADDDIYGKLGWPVLGDVRDIREGDTNFTFWPRTGLKGTRRKEFHAQKVGELLDDLFRGDANTIVAFDEVGYVESLSRELRDTVQMYWREARSLGITVIAMKQRPQGALRDMHSESYWTAAFRPKDDADLDRWAELFGAKRDWIPVIRELDPNRHEFILRHSRSREAFISWVDTPLEPQKIKRRGIRHIVGR
jgi:nucleoside-triphosphatase THEP1